MALNNQINIHEEDTLQGNKALQIIKDNIDPRFVHLITLDKAIPTGINSITFISVVVALESEFNFEFDDDMLSAEAFPTVQSIIDYVKAKSHT